MLDNQILKSCYQRHRNEIINDFLTFLKFPSISTQSEYRPQAIACVKWLKEQIEKIGFKTELWKTPSLPVLYASYLEAGPDKPTLLFYNHYDVQPVDPLEEWITPPFEPTIREGEIFARGAQDNKGQCWYIIQALRILQENNQVFPLNIKFCIEGEEESGSKGLSAILLQRAQELRADYLLIGDSGIPNALTPALTLGMRGIVTMDLEVQAADIDMHSGFHGGIALNPIQILAELLAKLHDAEGRVTIPGFYDDIKKISAKERQLLNFDFNQEKYRDQFGTPPFGGERHLPPLERAWLRPTLEINGISGGYTGDGFKTVIPAKAKAKISCRLVPNQEPAKIIEQIRHFFDQNCPEGIRIKLVAHGEGRAVRVDAHSPLITAFSRAYTDFFHKKCQLILGGGSIPIASELAKASKSALLLFGLGLPTDCIHAPNEHFGLNRLELGTYIVVRAIEVLAASINSETGNA